MYAYVNTCEKTLQKLVGCSDIQVQNNFPIRMEKMLF